MNGLLYFFDDHVKPHMLKGTRILNPADTGNYPEGISAIREKDVNLWLYTKDGKTLAVDTGHLNYPDIDKCFEKIGIDPTAIKHVLITHVDVDHVGGIDRNAKWNVYPNAEVYIGINEEPYLRREIHRMVKLGKKIYNCVTLHEGYHLVEDGAEFELDGFRIRCVEVPGHTIGHMCYIVDDKILFSGDTLAINKDGGYAFWDFFCQDPDLNRKNLPHLQKEVAKSNIKYVCTGHSGLSDNIAHLFDHIDQGAPFGRKVVFDENAPTDVCHHD